MIKIYKTKAIVYLFQLRSETIKRKVFTTQQSDKKV